MRPFARLIVSISCLAAALLVAQPNSPAQAPPPPPAQPGVAPMDDATQALNWILESQRNYRSAIRDYSCVFVAHENMTGKGAEDQIIHMKFRQQPFSVNMVWARPASMATQEVSYVQGKNDNKLRVKNPGLLKIAGFMSIDINDKRTKEHSRHTILEAGIGNLIDRTAHNWTFDRGTGKAITKIAEYKFDGRDCYRIETVHTAKLPQFYSYRGVIYLEKNSKYPLRNENYHWPVPGGNPQGELMESFSYTGLKFNVGLKDADFDR
jgi:hypothetical protein